MGSYYTTVGSPSTRLRALAYTIHPDAKPVRMATRALAWTPEAYNAFHMLARLLRQNETPRLFIPYRVLRSLLDLYVPTTLRQHETLALTFSSQARRTSSEKVAFAWFSVDAPPEPVQVRRAIHQWFETALQPLATRVPHIADQIAHLEELFRNGRFVTPTDHNVVYEFPWSQMANGTAHPRSTDGSQDLQGYPALADFVARALEGKHLAPGLDEPCRRLISRSRYTPGAEVKLISNPIWLDGRHHAFSLVVNVRIATLPTVPQPLIVLDVHKRRWSAELRARPFALLGDMTGYAFPTVSPIVVPFRVNPKKGQYQPRREYLPIALELHLPLDADGHAIVAGNVSSEQGQVYLTHRNGFGNHDIHVGVPEKDKLDIYENVLQHLEPYGLIPWDGLRLVEKSKTAFSREHVKTKKNASQQDKNRETTTVSGNQDAGFLPQQPLWKLVRDGNMDALTAAERKRAEVVITHNRTLLQKSHGSKLIVLIAWHEQCYEDANLAKATITALTTDLIECKLVRLPKDSHGPRQDLPHDDVKNAADRGQQRMEAWRSWTEALREQMQRDAVLGVLVIAPRWYGGEPDGFRPDDFVNKPAGRKAIASWAQQLTQYLLPPKGTQESNKAEFCLRAQNAWRDLIWAHYGQFKDLQNIVESFFPNGASPQEIIGIAIVRRNAKRTGQQSSDIPVALKLDLATNRCFTRFTYWDQGHQVITEWEPLRSGLLRLASLSPVRSGETRKLQGICWP